MAQAIKNAPRRHVEMIVPSAGDGGVDTRHVGGRTRVESREPADQSYHPVCPWEGHIPIRVRAKRTAWGTESEPPDMVATVRASVQQRQQQRSQRERDGKSGKKYGIDTSPVTSPTRAAAAASVGGTVRERHDKGRHGGGGGGGNEGGHERRRRHRHGLSHDEAEGMVGGGSHTGRSGDGGSGVHVDAGETYTAPPPRPHPNDISVKVIPGTGAGNVGNDGRSRMYDEPSEQFVRENLLDHSQGARAQLTRGAIVALREIFGR